MKQRRRFLIVLHVVLVMGLLAQTFQFIFAQDHGYLPPADPADQMVETWQDDGSGDWLEGTESSIAWQLPEQAETLFDLVPEHLPVVQAEPASKDEMGVVSESVTITPDGAAAFFLNEQLLLLFNQGTFTQDTQIALTPLEANTELSATSGPLDQLRFLLSATDTKTGEAILDLSQSYYLALDLTALATPDARWFAAFQNSNEAGTWFYPQPQRHNEAGIISVSYRAMGLVSAGNEALITLNEGGESAENLPKPWRYQWQVPAVSTFSGAATYQYPIEVPPGRGGLMPNIDISYSSSGANGHIYTDGLDQGPLGLGWNINQIEITRDKTDLRSDGAHYAMFHADQFSLVIDGQSYRLVRYAGDGINFADYYAINGPSLRIRQIYDVMNALNPDRLYWVVKSGNGTTYRLGFTDDAESGQGQNPGFTISDGNQLAGALPGYGGLRWRVDTVTDIHGNQIQYNYEKWAEDAEVYEVQTPTGTNYTYVTTTRSRLKEIRYNYVDVAANTKDRLTTNYGTKIVFVLTPDTRRVGKIQFYHLDFENPYRVINFGLGVDSHTNEPCGQGARSNKIELVSSIREEGSYGKLLPMVNFGYIILNHDPIHTSCFRVSYMNQVTNGYGGQVNFTYTPDGRHNSHTFIHPTYGQSFFVTKTETQDGIHLDPAVTTYNLEFPCYDQPDDGSLGNLPGATNCRTRPGININGHWYEYGYGALVGFAKATVTTHDYNVGTTLGPILNRTITQFQQAQATMGWVTWQELYDASLTLIQKQENNYSIDTDNESTFVFNYLAQQTTTQHVQGQSTSHTIRYEYGRQNNIQYGNQTKVIEEGTIGGIANKQRLVYRQYYPNTTPGTPWITTPWIVGAVAREAVFEGTAGVTINPDTATPIADSRNFYDSQTNWQTTPTRARLTRVDRLKTTAPLTYITVQKMVYDTMFTSNVEQVTDGNNHTTTTNYDGTYNLYPISVVNHLGHTQQFRYFDLNALVNYDGEPGLLRDVIDPHGFTTSYFYDNFGRLKRVFRGWTEQGGLWEKPSEVHAYSDENQTSVMPLRISTWRKTQDNATAGSTGGTFERQFFDGLGRVIQTQRPHTDWTGNWEGPTGGQRVIADTGYNAAGQAIWQSQPYFKPAGATYFSPDTSQARINTQYNAGGQAVRQVGLDGAVTSTMYGLRSVYQQDGNSHIRASFFDPTGQLTRVDETIDAFRDTFANTNNWTKTGSGSFTITGGHGAITHSGLGFTTINRVITANKKSGTSFSFKVTNGNVHSQLFMSRGNWGFADYRLWGLQVLDGQLRLQQWAGDSTTTNGSSIPLMPVKNNTWYRVILRAGYDGAFYNIVVWEENNPAISAEVRIDHHLDWAEYTDWKFDARTYGGNTLDIDTYDELDFYRTGYEYDVLGNLKKVTDAASNVTEMEYNNLGQKVTMNDPDMGNWSYGYDAAGNLTVQTDAKEQSITFIYDAINRLTQKWLDVNGQEMLLATYSYDSVASGNKGVGRRTGMVAYDPPGVVSNSASWTYDIMGRVIREDRTVAGNNNYRFDFGYTQGDLPVTVRYPGGSGGQQGELVTTNYHWITGQPTSLVGDGTYVSSAQYNKPTGQITRLNLTGSTLYTDYSYDLAFRLSAIKSISSGVNRLWYSYEYDPAGNISKITDQTPPVSLGSQVQNFQYDSLNRLVHAQATGNGYGLYNENYAYDEIGNLINKAGQEMVYGDGTAGPHAVTMVNGEQEYAYDDNGNMTQRPDGSNDNQQLYWTAENMLYTVGNSTETLASFKYDADGMMVLRTEGSDNGVSTVYLGKLYQHKLDASNVVTKHYMFNGQLVAQRTVDQQGGSSVTFLLGDHLGSTTTVLWASGAVKDNQRYNPWGEVRWAQSGNPITGYSYTSQRYDDALGLYDYNARYYDPTIGRFISADTIVPEPKIPQSLNRFAYTLNSPLRFIDPSGHDYEPAPDDPMALPDQDDEDNQDNQGDPVASKAASLEGEFHWQNPRTRRDDGTTELNNFYSYFRGAPTFSFGDIVTMNCWEMILYCALVAGEIDAQWIFDFYNVSDASSSSSEANRKIWEQLGAFEADLYDEETAKVGQLIFFTLEGVEGNVPGHVAIYTGHGQIMSLWVMPNGDYSVQATTVTELSNAMSAHYNDRPVIVTMVDPPWW